MENQETKSQADIEWEQRTLCRDESCIGVIGPDGRCKECGLPYEEEPSDGIKQEPAMENMEGAETEEKSEGYETQKELEGVEENGDEKPDLDLEWEQRTLCSDESCIGVIGPDGRCKECGKPYDSK
ncbi:MAG: hypothetical protein R6U40_09705 [Desulfobacterales bacterium]